MNIAVSQGWGQTMLFLIAAIVFVLISLLVARLLRPNRPNIEKLSTYESGEEPVGSAWGQFNLRFYVIAIIFLLFDVELVFLFPWARIFGDKDLILASNGLWGWYSLLEVGIFVGLLALGLAYVWAKGFLDWIKPQPKQSDFKGKVPQNLYDKINEKYS